MRSFFGLTVAFTYVLASCGGDVKVDGEPGSALGGAGGAGASGTSSSSTSSTTPSTTSSGPVPSTTNTGPTPACDCFTACQQLIDCFGDVPCDEFCAGVPPEMWQCVCNTPSCDEKEFCFGSSSTGGSGGGPSVSCEQCVNDAAQTSCSFELEQCFGDDACAQLFDCHSQCGFEPGCIEMCNGAFPGSVNELYQFMGCAVCGFCFDPCANTPLVNYCLDGEG